LNLDLSGKLALVTGGNKGIGKAVAVMLASSGAKVAISYLNNRTEAEETVALIEQHGGRAATFQADVSDREQIESLVSQSENHFAQAVDILVNNAGHLIGRFPNETITEEQYNRIMDVNLKSAVFMSKRVIPGMKASGSGCIINMSSLAAHNGGGPGASIYAAAKAALIAYTKGLAKEAAPYRIRANAVAPGFIGHTAFHSTFTPEATRKAAIAGIPLGREGTPEDVAGCVLYLVSPLASYVTGETIEINGGMYMK
jgi:3-oxoacyl-[acyl-carrier protein] reductase